MYKNISIFLMFWLNYDYQKIAKQHMILALFVLIYHFGYR
jgi:hypothetical protein